MTEHLKEIEHQAEEKVEALAQEAEEGKSPRTPLLVLSGVTIFLAVVVSILLAIAFTAYYLSK